MFLLHVLKNVLDVWLISYMHVRGGSRSGEGASAEMHQHTSLSYSYPLKYN